MTNKRPIIIWIVGSKQEAGVSNRSWDKSSRKSDSQMKRISWSNIAEQREKEITCDRSWVNKNYLDLLLFQLEIKLFIHGNWEEYIIKKYYLIQNK